MSHQELIQRLMKIFVLELREHVGTLNDNLLELEKATTREDAQTLINSLFRAAHSLKGAARSVELIPLERLTHRIEDLFVALRSGKLLLSQSLLQLLFSATDAIEQAGVRLGAGEQLAADEFDALNAELSNALSDPERAPPLMLTDAIERPTRSGTFVADQRPDSLVEAETVETKPILPQPEVANRPLNDAAAVARDVAEPKTQVQVSAEQLDRILARNSEFRIACVRYEERVKELGPLLANLRQYLQASDMPRVKHRFTAESLLQELDELADNVRVDAHSMRAASLPLDAELQKLRMVPFKEACEGMRRVVRDLAAQSGKQVELIIEGGELEIDRSLINLLRQSVLQLVRNAVYHGLETPGIRRDAGKPAAGYLKIRAELDGSRVTIEVEDDGQGLDLNAIRASADKLGIGLPEGMSAHEALIFMPGISSVVSATSVSGRGVGLDVVRSVIEGARGAVTVQSQRHRFTRFQLSVPLTLSTLRVLMIRLGDYQYALDIACVDQMLKTAVTDLVSLRGQQRVVVGHTSVPAMDLKGILGIASHEMHASGASIQLVIVRSEATDGQVALAVDDVVGIEDVLLKSLGPRLSGVPYVHGATLDRRGCPVPILNLRQLVGDLLSGGDNSHVPLSIGISKAELKHRLLVVDDSMTTRLLEENILRDAGFEVLSASDGSEAWHLLSQQDVDLVVSDVQMPGMDGIELTTAIRASVQYRDVPVILLTARDAEEDRLSGMNAGADAYLVKSAFELDELIQTIKRLLR